MRTRRTDFDINFNRRALVNSYESPTNVTIRNRRIQGAKVKN